MKNIKQSMLLLSAISLILSSCTGSENSKEIHNQIQERYHKTNDTNIAILNIANLDQLSKTCYSTVHYYDPNIQNGGKISEDIADDGSVGGAIFALENTTDSQSKCNFHLYKWQENFQTIQYANSDVDCSDRSLCSIDNYFTGYSNNGLFYGHLAATGGGGSFFYTDGLSYNLTQERFESSISPSLSHKIKVTYDSPFVGIYEYDISQESSKLLKTFNSSFNKAYTNDNHLSVVELGNQSSVIINNSTLEIHEYKPTIMTNFSFLKLQTLSNNSKYVYGVTNVYQQIGSVGFNHTINMVQINPSNNYNYQEISSFPFDMSNVELSFIKTVNDGVSFLSYKKYISDSSSQISINKKYYFYSTATGKFYNFNDVLENLNLIQYVNQITCVKFSENGKYMLLVMDKMGKSSTVAIRASFNSGLNNYLTNSVQPV